MSDKCAECGTTFNGGNGVGRDERHPDLCVLCGMEKDLAD